jgi:Rad3-related DNA helicase
MLLPKTAAALLQGCGRLLGAEQDHGIIPVLEGNLSISAACRIWLSTYP